jgi:S1-C subfamily serine protease
LLGWVRFFEIKDAGFEVATGPDGLRVTSVVVNEPPQVAGLRVSDIITAMDGTPVKDLAQFRRLLRHSTVLNHSVFTVRRGRKSLELKASFADWEPPPSPKPQVPIVGWLFWP